MLNYLNIFTRIKFNMNTQMRGLNDLNMNQKKVCEMKKNPRSSKTQRKATSFGLYFVTFHI